MVSDTNIKKTSVKKPKPPSSKTKTGSLTLRILAVNVIAPLVLVLGFLYMGQYRESLIMAELDTLKAHSRLFAGALAEGAVKSAYDDNPFMSSYSAAGQNDNSNILIPELSRKMVGRLNENTRSRARLFDFSGNMISDSQKLVGPGGTVQIVELEPPAENLNFAVMLKIVVTKIIRLVPVKNDLLPYPHTSSQNISDYPDARIAMKGKLSATAWEDEHDRIILSAAAPIKKGDDIVGVVLLTEDGNDIEVAMAEVRFDVLTVFLGALSITIFLSIYLAGVIGAPLRKLSRAAEQVRQSKKRKVNIPDMSSRGDEIGDLSMSLREMTQALWDRMDTIESFAADVAHEIKNPLTSLRSAVETMSKVSSKKDRERLLKIIEHDVVRLDRLISDISNISRLDAELSRDEMKKIDIRALISQIVEHHKKPLERGQAKNTKNTTVTLHAPGRRKIYVQGNESRLAQVFENLISNALSFSPKGAEVTVTISPHKEEVTILVEDEGPGIPENKLDSVFERFYTERPKHEDFGSHSGLGLSIAKQIVDSHGGQLYAENIMDEDGNNTGACFTVVLDIAD
jgi:two-component system sensor histidine kinase ChvG